MTIEKVQAGGVPVAVVYSEAPVVTDVQSALDLLMSVRYETGADDMVVNKEAFAADFFILSRGLAGEILQKFVSYHMRLAIYGDFSGYTSKPLHALIAESNRGRDFCFVETKEAALDWCECSYRNCPQMQ